jgi:hypothetical protein
LLGRIDQMIKTILIDELCISVRPGSRRKYFGRFFSVRPGFGDFGFFLILGATGHGCSAGGTDAAPRAHGTGALQASRAVGNKKNQIASRFDFFCLVFF